MDITPGLISVFSCVAILNLIIWIGDELEEWKKNEKKRRKAVRRR